MKLRKLINYQPVGVLVQPPVAQLVKLEDLLEENRGQT